MPALPFLRRPCLALLLSLLPLSAVAHPHVYIDASVGLIYDGDGRLSAVEVEWTYDELYSLLIVEDLGLDPDGDGILSATESAALQGFDADWEPGFDGRLYMAGDGRRIALGPPQDFVAEYRDGRVLSRHRRPLTASLAGDAPLSLQIYDPEFYVDFTLTDDTRFAGRDDCRTALDAGDPAAAPEAYRSAVEAALSDAGSDIEAELVVVDIGAAGAETLRVDCLSIPAE